MITVAILTRNRLSLLKRCVASILDQIEVAGFEILVGDTGSVDGTTDWLASQPPPLRWLDLSTQALGFAEARNAMVAAARGDIVAFLDDDCMAPRDWLSKLTGSVQQDVAAGGPVLPGERYRFPWWWSGQLAWTIGMSPPNLLRGADNHYPASANLAAWKADLTRHPFQPAAQTFRGTNIYLGGREDAQWWYDARIRGTRLLILPEAPVFHHVSADRVCLRYVLRRVWSDGIAACRRRTNHQLQEMAATDMFAALASAPLASLRKPADGIAYLLWAYRQYAYLREARRLPVCGIPLHAVARCAARTAINSTKRAAGHAISRTVRIVRPRYEIPRIPQSIYVVAPTYLGDTVLLQPALTMLAKTFPETSITVETNFPAMLDGLPSNIAIHEWQPRGHRREFDVCFVPYYHFGDPWLWRQTLSSRGITFSWDVGFPRMQDYHLAVQLRHKDAHHHEILNIVNLFSVWPLLGSVPRYGLTPTEEARTQLVSRFPELAGAPYATFQLGSGLTMKDWPAERWGVLAAEFQRLSGFRLAFIGSAEWAPAAGELVSRHRLKATVACGELVTETLTALLADARIAVGACSGPKHMAMALGVPTFTLYGPSSPNRWGPLWDKPIHGHICSPARELSPLEHAGLPDNHQMLQISTDEAMRALAAHFSSLPESRQSFPS